MRLKKQKENRAKQSNMKKVLEFIKQYKEELWSIPVALLIFWFAPYAFRLVDPTAGAYDAGVLQLITFAIVSVLILQACAWIGLQRVFPELFEFFQNEFKTAFSKLTEWQKVKVSLLVFFGLLAAFLLALRVI